MTTQEIFAALGGRGAVQEITRAKYTAVGNWLRCGIPYRYWPDIVDWADRHHVPGVTFDALRDSRGALEQTSNAA